MPGRIYPKKPKQTTRKTQNKLPEAKLQIARDYYEQIYKKDINTLIEIKTGENSVPAAEKNLLKFRDVIKKHNDSVLKNTEHPGVVYREPDLMIIICANASMAYTTEKGVKVIPAGCMRG